MKNRGVKREKKIDFFVNSTKKINVFYSYVYNDNKNIDKLIKKR